MGIKIDELFVTFGAFADAKGLDKFVTEVDKAKVKVGKALDSIGRAFVKVGVAAAGLTAIIGKPFFDLDRAIFTLQRRHAKYFQENAEMIGRISDHARQLAADTLLSAGDVTAAYDKLIGLGWKKEGEARKIVTPLIQLVDKLGGVDVLPVPQAGVGFDKILRTFGLGADQALTVAQKLQVTLAGMGEAGQLMGRSLPQVLETVAQGGNDLNETLALTKTFMQIFATPKLALMH